MNQSPSPNFRSNTCICQTREEVDACLRAISNRFELNVPSRIMHFVRLNSPYYCRQMGYWEFVVAVLWRMTWIPLDDILQVVLGLGEVLPSGNVQKCAGIIFG